MDYKNLTTDLCNINNNSDDEKWFAFIEEMWKGNGQYEKCKNSRDFVLEEIKQLTLSIEEDKNKCIEMLFESEEDDISKTILALKEFGMNLGKMEIKYLKKEFLDLE
jgi:hypothetical protein